MASDQGMGFNSEVHDNIRIILIEDQPPDDWRDLQEKVAQILRECGMDAETDKQLETARGTVNADVFAEDKSQTPATIYLWECKHWRKRVTKTVVHSIRSFVSDFGANWGGIVSSSGFQRGAYEAAQYSNVRLFSWLEFQALFKDRWFDRYFVSCIYKEAEALIEYTEPMNSRIFRKADSLSDEARSWFRELRDKYATLGFLALTIWSNQTFDKRASLELPLRKAQENGVGSAPNLPMDLLEAKSLRSFLDIYARHAHQATAEFDSVFGERA